MSVDHDLVRDRAPRTGHAVGVHRARADRVRPGAGGQPAERGAARPRQRAVLLPHPVAQQVHVVARARHRAPAAPDVAVARTRSSVTVAGAGSSAAGSSPRPRSPSACDRFVRCPDGLDSRLCTAPMRTDSTRSRHLPVPSPSAPDAIASCFARTPVRRRQFHRVGRRAPATRTVVPGRSPRSSVPSSDTSAAREDRFTSRSTLTWSALLPGLKNATRRTATRFRRRRVHRRQEPFRRADVGVGLELDVVTRQRQPPGPHAGPRAAGQALRGVAEFQVVRVEVRRLARVERQAQGLVGRVGVVVRDDRHRAGDRRAVGHAHEPLPPERVGGRRQQVHVPHVLGVRRRLAGQVRQVSGGARQQAHRHQPRVRRHRQAATCRRRRRGRPAARRRRDRSRTRAARRPPCRNFPPAASGAPGNRATCPCIVQCRSPSPPLPPSRGSPAAAGSSGRRCFPG